MLDKKQLKFIKSVVPPASPKSRSSFRTSMFENISMKSILQEDTSRRYFKRILQEDTSRGYFKRVHQEDSSRGYFKRILQEDTSRGYFKRIVQEDTRG